MRRRWSPPPCARWRRRSRRERGGRPDAAVGPVSEQALSFGCGDDSLVGVLHKPHRDDTNADIGVVVVVGGPQYRAGSHRQLVQLARALAAAGYPALRFDVRGMGDSSGALRDFEHITPDIGAAIDALRREQSQLKNVVLCGLCDGASAALLYLHDTADPCVRGLVLMNPWVRSATSLARTHVEALLPAAATAA